MLSDVIEFKWNEPELVKLLHSPEGAVVKDLIKRGILVEASAKAHASGRPGPMVRSGRLRASITWRVGVDAFSPYVDVGTAVEYGAYVELGTSRAPAYPYLKPGLEAARASF